MSNLTSSVRPFELGGTVALIIMADERLIHSLDTERQSVAVWPVFTHRPGARHIVPRGLCLLHTSATSIVFAPFAATPPPVTVVPIGTVRRTSVARPYEFR